MSKKNARDESKEIDAAKTACATLPVVPLRRGQVGAPGRVHPLPVQSTELGSRCRVNGSLAQTRNLPLSGVAGGIAAAVLRLVPGLVGLSQQITDPVLRSTYQHRSDAGARKVLDKRLKMLADAATNFPRCDMDNSFNCF